METSPHWPAERFAHLVNEKLKGSQKKGCLHLRPDERGLVQSTDIPVWIFPSDYIRLLRAALIETGPEATESRK